METRSIPLLENHIAEADTPTQLVGEVNWIHTTLLFSMFACLLLA